MTRNLNKELKKYYRDIGKALSGSKEKKAIITQIKSSVECYIHDKPYSTIGDIINHFGNPNEIADEYYNDSTAKQLADKLKKRSIISIIVFIIVTILFMLLVGLFYWQGSSYSGHTDETEAIKVSESEAIDYFEDNNSIGK